ncbi:MAG TPA: oligosaccharide flippase family protein [Gemmatimonadaceae bacterium]
MSTRRDTVMMLAAQSFYRLSGFVLVMVLARSLSAPEIGKFVFAMAFAESFVAIANFGMNSVMSRQVAADNLSARDRFAAVLGFRAASSAVYVVAVMSLALIFTSASWQIMLAATLIALAEDTYFSFGSLFLSLRKATYNVTIGMTVQTAFVIVFLVMMTSRPSLWTLVAVNAFRVALLVFISAWLTHVKLFRLHFSWDSRAVRLAVPFVMMAVVNALRDQLGAVMIGMLSSYDQVAFYNLVMRVSAASLAIPTAVCAVLSPLIVAEGLNAANRHRIKFATALILGFAFTGSVVIATLSEPVARILYGPLAGQTAPLLRILSVMFPVSFMALFASLTLQALYREVHVLRTMIAVTLVYFVANLVLIPQSGARGAIVAQIIAVTLQLAILGWDLMKMLSANGQPVVRDSVAPLVLPTQMEEPRVPFDSNG